jgi:hypothetical protein
MTVRATQLHATADGQIAELIDLLSTLDQAALRRPCPGREKLGDGTVGAAIRHTADNYSRIAGFVQTGDGMASPHQPAERGAHRMPRFLRAFGHGPQDHAEHGPGGHADNGYTADSTNPAAVIEQLEASRDSLGHLGELSDPQLDAIPAKDSFRFCDGQRTLEQVLAGLFKHQARQLDALRAAAG